MSKKRDIAADVLGKGFPYSDLLRNNWSFVRMRRQHFSECPEFKTRDELYAHVASGLNGPINYLEFGVWKGKSITRWSQLNDAPDSRFIGFDTFEGLPENWTPDQPKGTFSTQGLMPSINDQRVSFEKGLFQRTLYPFLERTKQDRQLVINVDCDLYSSTLFVLSAMDRYFRPGTRIIFDDFYSLNHEFQAFVDYDRAFNRKWKAIGKMPHCAKVAIEIESKTAPG